MAYSPASALFFAVQPGFVEAVAWVGAITDLLPALWYLLTLWMHLLPMMIALEATLRARPSYD